MANETSVDDWISDESDFYGSEGEVQRYEDRLNSIATDTYWRYHFKLPAMLARAYQTPLDATKPELYFPYDGNESYRQSNESPGDFVKRVPPRTTSVVDVGQWLWVTNPSFAEESSDEQVKIDRLQARGTRAMNVFGGQKQKITEELKGKGASYISRSLDPARKDLKDQLEQIAREEGVTSGKWMLFPTLDRVDECWRKVVAATAENQLGVSAKVGAMDTSAKQARNTYRLMCVYNKDFGDVREVWRILQKLKEMGILDEEWAARGIWYKCDYYTVLGIESNNDFGLRASRYGSRDMCDPTR